MVLSHRPIHLDKEQHLRKTELGCPLVAIMSSFAIKPLFHSNFPPCRCEFLLPNKSYFYQRASSCKPAPPEESGEANQRSPKKHTPPRKRGVLPQLSSVPSQALNPRLFLTRIFCIHFLLPAYPLPDVFIQAAPKKTCPQEQSAFQIAKGCSLLLFTTPNTEIQASFGGRHHLSTAAEGLCLQSL